jgi:hypothetical protein
MIEIPLTQNQTALIDDEDFELVSAYKWQVQWNTRTKSFYAVTTIRKPNGKRTTVRMHRLIMGATNSEKVDHIHHLTLDNRKSELRLCTNSQNLCNRGAQDGNTSGYKGVSWHKGNKKWQAKITLNGKGTHLGYFPTPELAHEAYCQSAPEFHGEFARTT